MNVEFFNKRSFYEIFRKIIKVVFTYYVQNWRYYETFLIMKINQKKAFLQCKTFKFLIITMILIAVIIYIES